MSWSEWVIQLVKIVLGVILIGIVIVAFLNLMLRLDIIIYFLSNAQG